MRIEEIPETTFRASHDSGGTLIICSGRHKITLAPEEVRKLLGVAFDGLLVVEALPALTPRKMAEIWRRQRVACGLQPGREG